MDAVVCWVLLKISLGWGEWVKTKMNQDHVLRTTEVR